ncbi:hypothetical protein [Bacteroides sp. 519]|uniref:hypothetical protein n=1 Tax=Bacteroides sp. 519 TaxID=2302937 RepID=UPI0013D0BF5F|nr:hypothetical protein [Bacteroides sp. 519]NDV58135.1 hypothetical protein [Bacteroides sp. 519]
MRKLYLFNPDHDLALANFDPNYMPSVNVRQLATDLALLPVWYGDEDDIVLAPSAFNQAFLDDVKQKFPHLPSICPAVEMGRLYSAYSFAPWGWNPAISNRLSQLGIPADNLPSGDRLEQIRQYSHRKLAVELLQKLIFNQAFCGTSYYYTDIAEIRKFVEGHEFCVLKAPLSGSGKGLNWCKGVFTYHIEHWCENIIKQQGGVVVEPLYNKVIDFAMQFKANEAGDICFAGYSFFQTTLSGAYMGNILIPDIQIEKYLAEYVPVENLELIKHALIEEFKRILPGVYCGYLGVDMMICSFKESPLFRIHPCVEVNLRMNMGMTSRIIYDRFVNETSKGMFRIEYYPEHKKLLETVEQLSYEHPLQILNGRVIKGYQPLIPVTPHSHYHAWIVCEPIADNM